MNQKLTVAVLLCIVSSFALAAAFLMIRDTVKNRGSLDVAVFAVAVEVFIAVVACIAAWSVAR